MSDRSCYDFNSESGGQLTDESGHGNHGLLQGTASLTADAAGHPHNQTGRVLDLKGPGEYVSVPSAASGALNSIHENDQVTVAFWLNGGSGQPLNNMTFIAGPNRQLDAHAPWSDSHVYFDVGGCCEGNQRINREADPTDYKDQWNHFAFVKDEETTSIYINGELFHSSHPYMDRDGVEQPGQGGDKLPVGEINSFTIGADDLGNDTHIGLFDDWAVWDVALSPTRIADLANGGTVLARLPPGIVNNPGLNGRIPPGLQGGLPPAAHGGGLVPEPSSLVLLAVGLATLIVIASRRRIGCH